MRERFGGCLFYLLFACFVCRCLVLVECVVYGIIVILIFVVLFLLKWYYLWVSRRRWDLGTGGWLYLRLRLVLFACFECVCCVF